MTPRRLVLTRSAAIVGAASSGLLLPGLARAQSNKVRVGLMLPYTGTYAPLGVPHEHGVRRALGTGATGPGPEWAAVPIPHDGA